MKEMYGVFFVFFTQGVLGAWNAVVDADTTVERRNCEWWFTKKDTKC